MGSESPFYPCLIILLHSNSEDLDKFVSIFERVPGSSELLRLRNLPFQVLGDKRDFVFLNFQSPQEEEEEAEVDFDRKRFFNSAASAAFAASARPLHLLKTLMEMEWPFSRRVLTQTQSPFLRLFTAWRGS